MKKRIRSKISTAVLGVKNQRTSINHCNTGNEQSYQIQNIYCCVRSEESNDIHAGNEQSNHIQNIYCCVRSEGSNDIHYPLQYWVSRVELHREIVRHGRIISDSLRRVAVFQVGRQVAVLSTRRPGFHHKSAHVGIFMGDWALGQVLLL